jgi:hypothetical protein
MFRVPGMTTELLAKLAAVESDCVVCDRPGADVVSHGFSLHAKCAPGRWLADDRDLEEFMVKVRQVGETRYQRWCRWK